MVTTANCNLNDYMLWSQFNAFSIPWHFQFYLHSNFTKLMTRVEWTQVKIS